VRVDEMNKVEQVLFDIMALGLVFFIPIRRLSRKKRRTALLHRGAFRPAVSPDISNIRFNLTIEASICCGLTQP